MVGLIQRPFDWRRECPGDVVVRRFPAVVGKGRGEEIDEAAIEAARRKLQRRRLTEVGETT